MMWLLTAWGGVKRVFGAVVAYPWQAALIIALLACGWFYMGKERALADLGKERAAHIATKVGYANAQKAAAELNKKQVARIESEYAAIAERTESDYEKSLADNRAALREWMRSKASKGNPESAGTSSAATVSSEAMPDTTEAEFLVSQSDLEIASDNYSQLVALREWALSIGKVETNARD